MNLDYLSISSGAVEQLPSEMVLTFINLDSCADKCYRGVAMHSFSKRTAKENTLQSLYIFTQTDHASLLGKVLQQKRKEKKCFLPKIFSYKTFILVDIILIDIPTVRDHLYYNPVSDIQPGCS